MGQREEDIDISKDVDIFIGIWIDIGVGMGIWKYRRRCRTVGMLRVLRGSWRGVVTASRDHGGLSRRNQEFNHEWPRNSESRHFQQA